MPSFTGRSSKGVLKNIFPCLPQTQLLCLCLWGIYLSITP
jgi:hypothetical protein